MEGGKMKWLTIVVPMYNIEKYITKCLDSFLIEEIAGEIEVLVIDDGSEDGSSEAAAGYERNYPDTFTVIRKENGGHGSAINRGIEEAGGRYFKVVDGDDWVEKAAFIQLVKTLKRTNADLIVTNYNWVDDGTGNKKTEMEQLCTGIEYEKEYPAKDVLNKTFLKMHGMTYRTELLKHMGERLDEKCFYVDTEYILFPLPYVRTVLYLNEFVYQYRIGLPSQSMSIENMKKRCGQHEKVLARLVKYYKEHETDFCSEAMGHVISRMAASQYKIYLSFEESHKSELKKMEEELQKDAPAIYKGIQNRAVVLLRLTNYCIYPAISWAVRRYLS